MYKKIVLSILLLCAMCNLSAQRIKGSDTVLPLSQRWAEEMIKENPDQSVVVTGGGSGVGILALLEGSTDLAQSSRPISFSERLKIKQSGKELREIIVAYDALAVIVNPKNPVGQVTKEQLSAIYRGKVKRWNEVGGEKWTIVPYSRETSSGTYEFFKEEVLDFKNYQSGVLNMPATGAIMQSVSQTKGAIGYVGLAYLNSSVKALKISYDGGKTYVGPEESYDEGSHYPIVRPLFYYYLSDAEEIVQPFLDFIVSDRGKEIVKDLGFIPNKNIE
ncbi:MAG: PstS family phosphate ABC transporter substrate-binding protein [Bacteroidales bacterium]|nr:PstS family phosphate ABC transporter substrate-binding protein [Bacteroidales bacterium]